MTRRNRELAEKIAEELDRAGVGSKIALVPIIESAIEKYERENSLPLSSLSTESKMFK